MNPSQIASLNRSQPDFAFGPTFESLEGRVYLNAAPNLAEDNIGDQYFTTNGALTIPLDGVDVDGDALTFTVKDNPNLQLYIPTGNRYARLHFVDSTGADMGDILVQLFDDRSKTAVDRFVTLATMHVTGDPVTQYDGSVTYQNVKVDSDGAPFYSNVVVHRVIPGFMVQTGDAMKGDGSGGSPLGDFADNFDPALSFSGPGVLAMANSGANTNDSQFFITDGLAPWLNQVHYIFGQMINGQDVLADVINLPRDLSNNRPDNPPKLEKVDIIESPQDGTLTMQAINGWSGETEVTVNIDDGHNPPVEKKFKVRVLGVDDPGDVTLPADGKKDVPINITGSGTDTVNITATSSNPNATVTISDVQNNPGQLAVAPDADHPDGTPATHPSATLKITTPAGYSGAFTVTVTVTKAGTGELSATRTIHVFKSATGDLVTGESGVYTLNGKFTDSVLVGDRLYAVSQKTGLEIFDFSPATDDLPARMTWRGVYKTPAEAVSVKVVGDTAYVVDTENGLFALNVSDPTHITKRDSLDLDGGIYNVSIKGNVAFLANFRNGITSVDIRDPNNLKKLGKVDTMYSQWLPGLGRWAYTTEFNGALSVAFKGNYAYVADFQMSVPAYPYNWGGIVVLNVSDPAHMTFVSNYFLGSSPTGVEVKGNNLYVGGAFGLQIFDITKPGRPTRIASLSPATILGRALVSTGYSTEPFMPQFTIADQTLIVGTQDGATFVDISDPAHPSVITPRLSLATGTDTDNKIQSILGQKPSVAGNQIAVPLGQYGLVMLDGSKLLDRVRVRGTQSFMDSHGVKVTISVRGKGSVLATTTERGQGDISKLEILGADADTVVTITTTGGRTTIGEIVCTTSLGSLIAPTVDLAGDLTIGGSLAKLTLGDVSGEHTHALTIHSTSADPDPAKRITVDPKLQLSMTLGRVKETTIDARDIPIKSLTVVDWRDNDATADTITTSKWLTTLTTTGRRASVDAVAGDFEAGLILGAMDLPARQAALGRATVAGAIADSTWTITGLVSLIRAGSTASTWSLTLGGGNGFLTALTTTGDLAGTIQAQWMGTIKSGATLTADLTATGFDASSLVAIRSIQAGSVDGATVVAMGGINAVKTTEWLDGSLDAPWIKSLITTGRRASASVTAVDGDFTADLKLNKNNSPGSKPVLGSLAVAGTLDGVWDIIGSAGAIKADSTASTWVADFQGTGYVASLTTKGDLSGSFTSKALKTVSVAGSIKDMHLTLLQAYDANAPKLLALSSLTAKGEIENSRISSGGSIGAVSALAMIDASIFAGVTDTHDNDTDGVLDLPVPGTDAIVAGASIGRLTVKGKMTNKVYEPSFINSNIAAGVLGTISLAYADFGDASPIYGLASATTVAKLMYRDASGAYVWPTKPADIGNFTVRRA